MFLTHWLAEPFAKNAFLDILVVILVFFRLDLGKISFNLVENVFAARQLALLAVSIAFYDILTRACVFRLFDFWIFLAFAFSPFLFFLLQWLTFYWGCLRLKNFLKSVIETGNFYHGAVRCSAGNFALLKFFTQLFERFCAYLRLHSVNHSDLGINGNTFSFCRSWV